VFPRGNLHRGGKKEQLRAHKKSLTFQIIQTNFVLPLQTNCRALQKAWCIVRISSPEPAIWLLLLLFVGEVN